MSSSSGAPSAGGGNIGTQKGGAVGGGMTGPVYLKGGGKAYLRDLLKKYSKNIDFYVGTFLVIAIAYVKYIPMKVRRQAGSLVGRLFLFLATLFIADSYSWLYGLFVAIFSALLLAVSPRIEGFQGFADVEYDVKLISPKDRKWFVEEVFKENPLAIAEDKVLTRAVQDNGSSNSTTSGR